VGEDGEAVVIDLDESRRDHGRLHVFRDLDRVSLECTVAVGGRRIVPLMAVADSKLRETEMISFLLAALCEHGLWRRFEGGARR
jgi:hypothetical protein